MQSARQKRKEGESCLSPVGGGGGQYGALPRAVTNSDAVE